MPLFEVRASSPRQAIYFPSMKKRYFMDDLPLWSIPSTNHGLFVDGKCHRGYPLHKKALYHGRHQLFLAFHSLLHTFVTSHGQRNRTAPLASLKMKSFAEKERGCETAFHTHSPYWHLCTPGNLSGIIFRDEADFIFGMNLLAWCAARHKNVLVLTFALMSNHIHLVCACSEDELPEFFSAFKRRLQRYLSDRSSDLHGFNPNIISIENLRSLRNTIVYVNRNGYVINPVHTPFSYPWSAGCSFFNHRQKGMTISRLTVAERRSLFRCRDCDVPDTYELLDGHICPHSFCDILTGESFFRDAHQYLNLVTKNIEAMEEMTALVNDSVYLTDDEVFSAVLNFCRETFKISSIRELSRSQKREIARKMHFSYHSSNEQIRRILGLDRYEVDSLFPLSKHWGLFSRP